MSPRLTALLADAALVQGDDGVWVDQMLPGSADQAHERALRERVAALDYEDHLAIVAQSHSIPVMDHEVDRFLSNMPGNALILDIGGCWGWHWRRIAATRPDIEVVIADFIRGNLRHARAVLGSLVGEQVTLVHADATALPFPDGAVNGFDGIWTVQAFQHIPDFARAVREAHRVLKVGGRFINYSQHNAPLIRGLYRLLGRSYHIDGMLQKAFHHTRANDAQARLVSELFEGVSRRDHRYTECFFLPDLKLRLGAREGSLLGRIDAWLGGHCSVGRWFANQRSYEAIKR